MDRWNEKASIIYFDRVMDKLKLNLTDTVEMIEESQAEDELSLIELERKNRADVEHEQGEKKALALDEKAEQERRERLDIEAEYPEPDKKYYETSQNVRNEAII